MSNRNLTTTTRQVFGDVRKGTECRICGRDVDDGRSKYCDDYCRNLARAVMGMLNWNSVRRKIIGRDDETCQECGYDHSKERLARYHIKDLVDSKLPERPEGPSVLELGSGDADDFDWDAYHEKTDEWNEQRDELRERYGNWHDRDGGLEVDHITPVSEGGHPFDPGNLQTLCEECHKDKTAAEASERADRRTPSRGELSESLFEYTNGDTDLPTAEVDTDV